MTGGLNELAACVNVGVGPMTQARRGGRDGLARLKHHFQITPGYFTAAAS